MIQDSPASADPRPAATAHLDPSEKLSEAIELHRTGSLESAEAMYECILAAIPDQADALHFLGILRHQQGRSEEAVALMRRALAAAPDYVDAWNNLGNVYKETERLEEAEWAYREALARNDAYPPAWNNLGVVLGARGAWQEAVEAHRRVLDLAPNIADAYYNLANALRQLGDPDAAIAACRRALVLNPEHTRAYNLVGYMLYVVGRPQDAAAMLEDWLAMDPGNPIATHMLAATGGGSVPDRAADDYVRRIFNQFADSFDEQLLQRLDYHAPQLLAASLAEVLGEPRGDLAVLDAGCGTGLCGPLLRPYAHRLTGVDLSRGMLEKARTRGGYDELCEHELTDYLAANEGAFDVVGSADTLVYFGALDEVASAARAALRPRGWLAFTVERSDDADRPFRINPHGRYSHTEDYLRTVLDAAGFSTVSIVPAALRQELSKPVDGWVVRAQAGPARADELRPHA
ncbi:tetratricopeptide repeat protein [soil metagenome]|nr:tetratricopeptide repeat protein [Gemmatimonadota bacterium]